MAALLVVLAFAAVGEGFVAHLAVEDEFVVADGTGEVVDGVFLVALAFGDGHHIIGREVAALEFHLRDVEIYPHRHQASEFHAVHGERIVAGIGFAERHFDLFAFVAVNIHGAYKGLRSGDKSEGHQEE